MKLLLAAGLLSMSVSTGCVSTQQPITLEGSWENVHQRAGNYLGLFFTKNEAVFNCLGDTVLRFGYRLDQQARTLWLTDVMGKRVGARIIKATADSIVFAQLWGTDLPQRFGRNKPVTR